MAESWLWWQWLWVVPYLGSIIVGHRYWMPPPRQFQPMFQVLSTINIRNSPFLKVKVEGIGCNELAEVFVTIVIPIIELEKPFFPTSFQIVSYLLKMQYKVFDKVVFSCFKILLFICFENEGF